MAFAEEAQKIAEELFYQPTTQTSPGEPFPETYTISLEREHLLRYGANPHQRGAVYLVEGTNSPFKGAQHLLGRELDPITRGLSGTNVGDIDAGIEAIRWLKMPAAVIIKHHNSSGIAIAHDVSEAGKRAIKGDPESAFGGVLVVSEPVTPELAQEVSRFKTEDKSNIDAFAAPSYLPGALEILQPVRDGMGVYSFGEIPKFRTEPFEVIAYRNAYVLQEFNDDFVKPVKDWNVMGDSQPTPEQTRQMLLAWYFANHVKSNSIVVMDGETPMSRGIGTGQTSRIRSIRIALAQAGGYAYDGIMASDGFIPFKDNIEAAHEAGIAAIVQPGKSKFDKTATRLVNEYGMVMVSTNGHRGFRH